MNRSNKIHPGLWLVKECYVVLNDVENGVCLKKV